MQSKKSHALFVGISVIVVAFIVVFLQQNSKKTQITNTTTDQYTTYTVSAVATHKTKTDCWTIVNGSVYDVTSWISKHPGGAQAIVSLCGIDGSSAFGDQHGGQRKPEQELASFKIGTIVK